MDGSGSRQRVDGGRARRVPWAVVTAALLIATGAWAVVDGRGPVDQGLTTPQQLQADGNVATNRAVRAAPGVADARTGVDVAEATAAAPIAGAGPGLAAGDGAAAADRRATGGDATAAALACPDGLDKGDCTGVTDTTIRIGTHAAASQCGTPLPDTTDPNEAEAGDWLLYVNQIEGGIHGRQLELYEADDGYCPEMAGAAANQLIDENRVFAVQGFLGIDQNRVVLEKASSRAVPYLAGGSPREWAQRWAVFHQSQSNYDTMFVAQLKYIVGARGLNKPDAKIGMMYLDTPDGKGPMLRSFEAVPEANIEVAIPLSQGIKQNFLEEIRQMQAAGVDTVYCLCHPLNMVAFVQQADAQQFKPQYSFTSLGADLDAVLRLFPGNSTWAANAKGLSNFCHQTHPCSKPYEAKLKQINPDAIMSQLSLIGIHTIEMFAEPLRRAGRDLSRARYKQALQGLNGWSSGLTGPVHLAPDRSAGAQGFAVYHSPGRGARNYKMITVDGQAFRNDWS